MGLNSEKKESRDDRKKKGNSGLHKIVFALCLYDAIIVGGISGIFFVPDYWYICTMNNVLLILLCLFISAPMQGSAATPHSKKMSRFVETELSFAAKQSMSMYESVKDQKGRLPNRTDRNDEFKTCPSNDWVSGFYPGLLWYIYEDTGDAEVRSAAEDLTRRLEKEQYNTKTHDLGFMIGCSFGNGYRLTGREDYRQVLLNAAGSLASRFNPAVGCTRSWNKSHGWDFIVIIDNMMNLELLTMASGLGGNPNWYEMAKTHANTTIKNHFREDNSSYHVVDYDEATGKVRGKATRQGYADESAWARGQAWGLYGFTMMYRQTGDPAYLEQAVKIADFISSPRNLPKDKIAYWDYNAPVTRDTPRDASAAAIDASALIELSRYTAGAKSKKYLRLAEQILFSLSSQKYRAQNVGDNHNFILKHSTIFWSEGNFDTAVTYADYYYVEALMRYKRLLQGRPVVDVCTAK